MLSNVGETRHDLEVQLGTPGRSSPYSPSLLTTDVASRGSPAFRGIKVIVVHGELKEIIQDVSCRWGMGLGSRF